MNLNLNLAQRLRVQHYHHQVLPWRYSLRAPPQQPHQRAGPCAPTHLLFIREVRDSGTLVVTGMCGTLAEVHSTNCAPCHLPNIDPTIYPALRDILESHTCHTCGSPGREEAMLVCDGCTWGYHLHCLEPPLSEVPEESPWCCPDCHQQGITPAIPDTLLRQDLQQQGLDRPELKDQRQIMEDKAAGMDGQLVMLNVLQDGMADRQLSGRLHYLPLEQRKTARRPLLLEVEGFAPAYMTVGKAQRATSSRLSINLSPARDATLAPRVPVVFVAARSMEPPSPIIRPLANDYNLSIREGLEQLYQDAFGVLPALPTQGQPLEWMPDVQWVLDRQTNPILIDPITLDNMQLLFAAVDIQGCLRVADQVAQSPSLLEALQLVKSSPTNPPHPANWLCTGYRPPPGCQGPGGLGVTVPPALHRRPGCGSSYEPCSGGGGTVGAPC
jgi:hypothetical protein